MMTHGAIGILFTANKKDDNGIDVIVVVFFVTKIKTNTTSSVRGFFLKENTRMMTNSSCGFFQLQNIGRGQ
jgi:hypothetical protein